MSNRDLVLTAIFVGVTVVAAASGLRVKVFKEHPGQAMPMQAPDTETTFAPDTILAPETIGPNSRPNPDFRIQFNFAKAQEIRLLPGVGERLADELLRFRDANFPIKSADQLSQVPGIGPVKLREMTRFLDFSTEPANLSALTQQHRSLTPQYNPRPNSAATQELADWLP